MNLINNAQPFCDQCSDNFNCLEIFDLNCVAYHFGNPNQPSLLINLGLPNGTSGQAIVEAIDRALGQLVNEPLSETDTNSIHIILDGAGNRHIEANLILSASSGNTAAIRNDGLYVPLPDNLYKVKVDANNIPYYLEDALIGGTDGIVSLSFVPQNGILFGLPLISLPSLVQGIATDTTAINELSTAVVNSIINNSTLLSSLTSAVENAILNDSDFLTNLTSAIINNPDALADLCAALADCSGSTATCPAPYIISSAVGVEASGGTVVLTINYNDADPVPSMGYLLGYRTAGSSDPYTVVGPFIDQYPIQVFGLPIGSYEGYLESDCSGTTFSSGATFVASLPCGPIADSYILGSTCTGTPITLYTDGPFMVNSILYTDSGLTTAQTGWSTVVHEGNIYSVDAATGKVLALVGPCPDTAPLVLTVSYGGQMAGINGATHDTGKFTVSLNRAIASNLVFTSSPIDYNNFANDSGIVFSSDVSDCNFTTGASDELNVTLPSGSLTTTHSQVPLTAYPESFGPTTHKIFPNRLIINGNIVTGGTSFIVGPDTIQLVILNAGCSPYPAAN